VEAGQKTDARHSLRAPLDTRGHQGAQGKNWAAESSPEEGRLVGNAGAKPSVERLKDGVRREPDGRGLGARART